MIETPTVHGHEDAQVHSWIVEIRRRLGSPPPRRLPAGETRQAAVLVPLYVEAQELWTILTERSADLPHHKSQIAFPGGGRELGEAAWETALREAREEIHLPEKAVLRLGELDETETPSGFRIVPCVGAVPEVFEPEPDGGEIADVFSVPLSAFANPTMVEDRPVSINGVERTLRIYHVGRRRIWGLTARILQNLLRRLGLEADEDLANPPV
ncbi:MAG: CoA pyrophosphatase [Acidobacteriota bacterium]|jgi:8-oxo-dGTP pyrophosphatase MutT (NUDIX family)